MSDDRLDAFSWRRFFLRIARTLGVRTGPAPEPDAIEDDWGSNPQSSDSGPLDRLLLDIERDALAVYAANDLPTRTGHYARAPGDRIWQFVAERMTPEDRWGLLDEYPPQDGWRFATLQKLGRYEPDGSPTVAAAALLDDCFTLRDSPQARQEATMLLLERSIRLGAAWQSLAQGARDEPEPVEIAKPKRIARRKTPD